MLSCLDSPTCCTYRAVPWLFFYFRLPLVFSICQLERSQLFSYPVIIKFPQGISQTSSTAFPSLLPSQHVICSALRCPCHIATCVHIRHMTSCTLDHCHPSFDPVHGISYSILEVIVQSAHIPVLKHVDRIYFTRCDMHNFYCTRYVYILK